LLKDPTIRPPITPVIIPAKGGAPEATAIPKHNGRATKKTTSPERVSVFINENIGFLLSIFMRSDNLFIANQL
jgi:hypothetical protein